MARDYLHRVRSVALVALALLGLARAGPPETLREPSLILEPSRVRPGDAFLVTVRGADAPRGELLGRPLRFYPIPGGFRALAGLAVEASPGLLPVSVATAGPAGETTLSAELVVTEPAFAETRLRVAQRFISPPPEAKRRMK